MLQTYMLGHTPRVATNHSWSPAYKALSSAKEIVKRKQEMESLSNRLFEEFKNGAKGILR